MSSSEAERPDLKGSPNDFSGGVDASEKVQSGVDFYRKGSDAEAERLRRMAEIADTISIGAINELRPKLGLGGPTVLDIGAGDSLSLGLSLRDAGYSYVPVDVRSEAVDAHQQAGFEAVQAMATKLPPENETVDVAHSRFTWGWLASEERLRALAEMLRVGRDDSALTVIDYDWSTVKGPEIFLKIIENVKEIMRQSGFDPDYGAKLKGDIEIKLGQFLDGGYIIDTERTPTYSGAIDDGLDVIEQTARAIIDQLEMVGQHDRADKIASDLALLQAYVAQNPDEAVSLPEIVAAKVKLSQKSSHYSQAMETYLSSYSERRESPEDGKFIEGRDFVPVLPEVSSLSNVVVATSPAMIRSARVIQTVAYVKDGIVGLDAVGQSGTLSEEIDPAELVNRSVYFASMLDDQRIGGMIRIITQDKAIGALSLPTLDRLYRHSPQAWQWLQNSEVMAKPESIIEVSGLAKNMLGGSFEDTIRAMLVMSEFVRQNGFDYGIMGLQKSKLKLIEGIFGPEAIRRIQGEDSEHPVDLPGVKDAIRFVPLYVDARQFAKAVNDYTRQQQGKTFAALTKSTQDIIDSRAA